MGRHYIIVDDKHKDDGYRREEMYRRMGGYRGDGYRMTGGVRMGDYRESEYDEGYRTGYEHGYRDREQDEDFRRMRDSHGRFM